LNGLDMQHVPYKGLVQGLQDIMTSRLDVMFAVIGGAAPHLKAGKMKALAVSGKSRNALIAEVPTFTAAGFPDFDASFYFGLAAPAGTPHDNAALRAVEDRCIRECIAMQERIGLQAVTDGEFRRRSWWLELVLGWAGFEADRTGSARLKWRNENGVTQGFSELRVKGKIRWRPSSVVRAFQFLKSNTQRVSKVTMPAPNCVHYYTGGNLGVYKDDELFWDDL